MRETSSYPSYDNNERRAKQFIENARYLEQHAEEIERDAYKVDIEGMEENLRGPIGKWAEELLGTAFTELSVRERFSVGSYLFERGFGESDIEKLQVLSRTFGPDVLRTCLVTENNNELQRAVFRLARELPRETATELFHGFADIVRGVDDLEAYMRSEFGSEDFVAFRELVERQLNQSREFLRSAHAERRDAESLRSLLEEARQSNGLFLNACRLLRKEGKFSLEAVRDGSLEIHSGGVNAQDADIILKIQEERYRGKYPEPMQKELLENLTNALESSYSRFYLYRKNGEIITFVRFDELAASNDEEKHMGSFMTNPKFEGGALGQALLEVALQNELGKGQMLHAECDPSLVSFYEKFGFRLLRGPYKDDHDVETCDIVLEPESLRAAA